MSSERRAPELRLSGEEQLSLLKRMSKSLLGAPDCASLCLPGLAKRRKVSVQKSFPTVRGSRLRNCLYIRPNASVSVSFFVLVFRIFFCMCTSFDSVYINALNVHCLWRPAEGTRSLERVTNGCASKLGFLPEQ